MIKSYMCMISILLTFSQSATGCYTSIFAFGDSLTDNGNLVHLTPHGIHQGHLPNGETYFHRPTGRCCDGRLIVDFLAQYFGLPIPPPYMGIKNSTNSKSFSTGVNFAVAGARTLDTAFYDKLGIYDFATNVTLRDQMDWFRDFLPSFCDRKPDCQEKLKKSIFLMGSIGGDDYLCVLFGGKSKEEREWLVPLVTKAIASTVNELIELGVGTIMVPGLVPEGCLASILTYFGSPNEENYDPSTGCIIWDNKFAEYHNELLQRRLKRVRELHPSANVIYADYYNAIMQLYRNPENFGFRRTKAACCGGGGPFNCNISIECGDPLSTVCLDPSSYINWDGLHFTEAANRWVALGLIEGSYSIPKIDASCIFQAASFKHHTNS